MGFDIHITRAAHWCRSAGFEISSKEWTDFIAATSWLTFDAARRKKRPPNALGVAHRPPGLARAVRAGVRPDRAHAHPGLLLAPAPLQS